MARIELRWRVGFSTSADEEPREWVPAEVPGAVQLDWAKAQGWPEWWKADEFRRYRWMEDVWWTYRAVLPDLPDCKRASLVVEDADPRCVVRRDGITAGETAGPQGRLVIPIRTPSAGQTIDIVLPPAPMRKGDGTGRIALAETTKPSMFYGWDFAPRLVPLGIAGGAYLESTPEPMPEFSSLSARATPDGDGVVEMQTLLSDRVDGGTVRWQILGPTGEIVHEQAFDSGILVGLATIRSVRLWWPNGEGEQPLYTSRLLIDDEVYDRQFGFRTIRLEPYEGMWEEDHRSPGTRWEPPMTLVVNDRRIFGKGANWVPPSMFPGTDTRQTYEALLRQCRDAGFNLLRVWGGGGVPKDDFFDLCDELGILIWQEFPLACERYEGTGEYLRRLRFAANTIVCRLRHHASLAIWCGGNELFCSWSRMNDQDAALRLLNSVTFELDPERPFLPTSPIMGVGHGGYTFVDRGREIVRYFQDSRCTAYTEFGCSGPASADLIRKTVPPDELWPPKAGTNWEWHSGFGAWDGNPDSWLMLPLLEEYLGPFDRLEDLVSAGRLLQAEGMRHVYEEARRQKPRCSMALCWCLNEPWPTVANNSLISWPAEAKPAMRAVREACRPVLATSRFEKMRWTPGEIMSLEPCILNDTQETIPETTVEAWIEGTLTGRWTHPAGAPGRNVFAPTISISVPPGLPRLFHVRLRCPGREEWNNVYRLISTEPEIDSCGSLAAKP